MRIVPGDLFNYSHTYVVQQNNCVGNHTRGFSRLCEVNYGVNPYKSRSPNTLTHTPGTVLILKSIKSHTRVVCLFGQIYPGKSMYINDFPEDRKKYFTSALASFLEDLPTRGDCDGRHEEIAIPYGIGCGLAGGNWDDYFSILKTYDGKFQAKGYEIVLYRIVN